MVDRIIDDESVKVKLCQFSWVCEGKAEPNKKIYDPFTIHSAIKDKKPFASVNKVCKNTDAFIQVPEHIFDQYVSFLRTNNRKLFMKTQREIG